MGRKRELLFCLVFAAVAVITYGQQCNVSPKCTCQFGDDNVDVEEQNTGTEALAGAVGAVSSALVTGGGFGIWYFVKGRKSSSIGSSLGRSDSELSEESGLNEGKKSPPTYVGQGTDGNNTGFKRTNVYRGGMNDPINPTASRVGSNNGSNF